MVEKGWKFSSTFSYVIPEFVFLVVVVVCFVFSIRSVDATFLYSFFLFWFGSSPITLLMLEEAWDLEQFLVAPIASNSLHLELKCHLVALLQVAFHVQYVPLVVFMWNNFFIPRTQWSYPPIQYHKRDFFIHNNM